jgi:hypothetical protein
MVGLLFWPLRALWGVVRSLLALVTVLLMIAGAVWLWGMLR